MSTSLSDSIDNLIAESVKNYDGTVTLDNPFEELLSLGEIIDRLTIVNCKLFTLKNQVMGPTATDEFKSWAADQDVRLVVERSRLKKCVDVKVSSIVKRLQTGSLDGGFVPEVKNYGGMKNE